MHIDVRKQWAESITMLMSMMMSVAMLVLMFMFMAGVNRMIMFLYYHDLFSYHRLFIFRCCSRA